MLCVRIKNFGLIYKIINGKPRTWAIVFSPTGCDNTDVNSWDVYYNVLLRFLLFFYSDAL